MSPPACESRQVRRVSMPLVDKTSRHASRPAVQILIAAPYGEVRAPLVKLQLQISCGVRQIKTNHTSPRMTRARYASHIERLPGRVIHSTQHDQRDLVSRTLDQRFNL